MMKSLMAALILTLAFLTSPAEAQNLCAELFSGPDIFASEHLQQIDAGKTVLGHDVFLVKRRTLEKKRLLLKPKVQLAEWFDFRNTSERPGDIRWGPEFLPANLKTVLGLKTFDQKGKASAPMAPETFAVQLPVVQTVIEVFKLLEAGMHVYDPHYHILNFYEAPIGAVSGRTYLVNFARGSRLPFSSRGHLYEHDLNFHAYSSLVLPGYVSKALRLRAEAFLDLIDYVGSRAEHSKAEADLKVALEKYVYRSFVERIDSSTGNLFASWMLLKSEKLSTIMAEVDLFLQVSFAGQTSPQKYINTLLGRENLGAILPGVLNDYWAQAPAKFKQRDLSQAFVENPAEFYNDAQASLKTLDLVAAGLLKK
jgi:hypothetical protein